MELEPDSYRKISGFQERDARGILRGIPRSITQGVDTIVDIGCGTGTVTNMVAQTIPHRRYIAVDVDPAMLDYARNYTSGSIHFIQQDCGVPFDQVDPEMKALEGSVDFVWCNYVIHWIPPFRRQNAIEMVHKLLKPGGIAYISVPFIPLVLKCCSKKLRDQLEDILIVPTYEEQLTSYKQHFQQSGFTTVECTRREAEWTYDTVDKFTILRKLSTIYGMFMPENLTQEERVKYFRLLEEPMLVYFATKCDGTAPSDMKEAKTVYYWYMWFVVIK